MARVRARVAVIIAATAAAAACNTSAPPPPPAGSPAALAAYLQRVAASDDALREHAVASWQLDEATWSRSVAADYRPLYAEYAQAFAAAAPALAHQLAAAVSTGASAITARRHFAGDLRLTRAQARERWAVPTLFPSAVAEAGDGTPIDAVFVADGDRWFALLGVDAAVRARVAAHDPACAARLALAGPPGPCSDVGAAIARAALRTDSAALAHACQLSETLCGKESP